jgi:hypothetical protein
MLPLLEQLASASTANETQGLHSLSAGETMGASVLESHASVVPALRVN